MKKYSEKTRFSNPKLISLLLVPVAVPAALVIYTHFFVHTTPTNSSSEKQEAGQTSITNRSEISDGGNLQKGLIGNEKPQDYLRLQTTRQGQAFFPLEETVHTGEVISVTLENNNQGEHAENWVLLKPGAVQEIVEAARNNPKSWDWISTNPNVLAYVPKVSSGAAITRIFRAPNQPGDYPYVCTSSDQCSSASGVLHVVS